MAAKRGLGRGLAALINDGGTHPAAPEAEQHRGPQPIPVERIEKNAWQPRRAFDRDALDELVASVRERGILQPLLVRSSGDSFQLIAGERRLRAAIEAGLKEVPAIVMDVADAEALQIALVENLQREDLNVLEEAAGYRALAETFNMTQEQIAQRVGKARASVTNVMRLLSLPEEVRRLISEGQLSPGHAKLLTGLDTPPEQLTVARRVVKEGLSVRNLEALLQRVKAPPRKPRAVRADIPPQHLADLSDRLTSHFGAPVRITPSRTYANGRKAKGAIEIDFYSNEDLDRILETLSLTGE